MTEYTIEIVKLSDDRGWAVNFTLHGNTYRIEPDALQALIADLSMTQNALHQLTKFPLTYPDHGPF